MENKIPIPTDNIFKFYAFFGLLLFIFSAGSIMYVVHSTNELAFQAIVEIETIKQIPNPSPVDLAKKQVLEKRLEIGVADKKFYLRVIGVFTAVSIGLMIYGFKKWHKDVQPVQDEITRLQLEKLRHEVGQLKHQAADNKPPKLVQHPDRD